MKENKEQLLKDFKEFIEDLGASINKYDIELIKRAREIVSKINEYFFTTYEDIGSTKALDDSFQYFSKFHKFWEGLHKEILNPKINDDKASQIAEVLHEIYKKYGREVFLELYETKGMKKEAICKVRYFTANQDFRGSRDFQDFSEIYSNNPDVFDKKYIYEHPEKFLALLGLTNLSQSDKRTKYATTAAKLLIDNKIEPFELFTHCNKDLQKVKNLLLDNKGSGYGNKKTDMFIRDMVVLGVWENPENFDKIDVASDINTIKVALRTGLIQTDILLVSSFMDIFCYQYMLIDEINTKAWRKVWEIWHEKYPSERIESPCLIDYLVYRIIGKEFCKESLYIFECETKKHQFKWHSGRIKTCQICAKEKVRNKAYVVKKIMPCTDDEGYIVFENSHFVKGEKSILKGLKTCPFESICGSKTDSFRKLNPPKSISILGQTGWESARVSANEGGGGLMS